MGLQLIPHKHRHGRLQSTLTQHSTLTSKLGCDSGPLHREEIPPRSQPCHTVLIVIFPRSNPLTRNKRLLNRLRRLVSKIHARNSFTIETEFGNNFPSEQKSLSRRIDVSGYAKFIARTKCCANIGQKFRYPVLLFSLKSKIIHIPRQVFQCPRCVLRTLRWIHLIHRLFELEKMTARKRNHIVLSIVGSSLTTERLSKVACRTRFLGQDSNRHTYPPNHRKRSYTSITSISESFNGATISPTLQLTNKPGVLMFPISTIRST